MAKRYVNLDNLGDVEIVNPSTGEVLGYDGSKFTDRTDAGGGGGATTSDYKESVRVATLADVNRSGTQTIDGVSLVVGDRVLVKHEGTAAQNGIYVVQSSTWTRATDADSSAEVNSGMLVYVEEGTVNGGTLWALSTPNPITLDTTSLTFTEVSGGGGGGVSDHGALTGLADDDHTQYAKSDGTRLRAYRNATPPSSPSTGQLWIDPNGAGGNDVSGYALNVLDFGAKADGVQDDAPYIWATIQAASTRGISDIVFPWGATGVYKCATRIVSGVPMPKGLTFHMIGRRGTDDVAADGCRIEYTGTGICWDILEGNGVNNVGRYSWRNFKFRCTNPAGGMHRFNDLALNPEPVGDTTPRFINHVRFEGCLFFGGATNGTDAVGHAIQAMKTFELQIDEDCHFRNWHDAVKLKACDNCDIKGEFEHNVSHIVLTGSGTFGNDNRIAPNFLGPNLTDGSDPAYKIYDSCTDTRVFATELENGADAWFYLNGEGCTIYSPSFSPSDGAVAPLNTFLHIGPNARETKIYNPFSHGVTSTLGRIVYDAPTNGYSSWLFNNNQNPKITVYSPNRRMEDVIFTPHPRLKLVSDMKRDQYMPYLGTTGAAGASFGQLALTSFNLEHGFNMGGFGYTTPVADANALAGYAMSLAASTGSALLGMIVGRDVAPGETVQVAITYKNASTPGSGTLRYAVENDGITQTTGVLPNSNSYQTHRFSYAMSGFTVGDIMGIGVYQDSNVVGYVSAISVSIGAGATMRWGTAAPTTGYHAPPEIVWNTAPAAGGAPGWVCVTAGTPGTWKAMASLAA
jgi:hypothetical protein